MVKEVYEKPKFDEITILCEVFTDDSPEETTGECVDEFGESCEYTETNNQNGVDGMVGAVKGTTDSESLNIPIEETDLSGLDGLINEINEIVEGSSSEVDTTGTETGNSESETPVEEEYSDAQQDVPSETFEEPSGGDQGSSSDAGFDGGTE